MVSTRVVCEDMMGWVDEGNTWVIVVYGKVRKGISSMGGWSWIENDETHQKSNHDK